ncbi:MAG TPA: beta-glucosidase BglX, partial [Candidatus Angelobacter sp.]|nr:beta-glucosidase BglX [Candidatus Angelobacter sp.]
MRADRVPQASRNSQARLFLTIAIVLLGVLTLSTGLPAQNGKLTAEQRADALLKQMTVEEKIGQLNQAGAAFFPDLPPAEETVRKGLAGSVLWLSGPADINKMQKIAVQETRLHIPLLIGLDVIHGYHTIFPPPLAMSAAWDAKLVERVQTVAAREARAAGINWSFAPMVDIARDARWGRMVEGAGEDPYLGAIIAKAQVRGFQGPELGTPEHVLACVKHFAAYGAADGGRDYDSSYVSDDLMWNVYFPPFKAAIDAGVGSLMSAYMDLNEVPASGNYWLLHDVLREDWKFQGFVVSDAFAVDRLVVHGYARDRADAAEKAFRAGVNMDMASFTYVQELPKLIQSGKISMAALDAMVRPMLVVKYKLGLFENAYIDESKIAAVMNDPASAQLAREATVKSMVLLKNDGAMLPLDKSGKKYGSIAVIGPVADSGPAQVGFWGGMITGGEGVVTVIEGIKQKVGSGIKVEYAKGPSIRRAIKSTFEGQPGIKLHDEKAQSPAEAQAAFDEAVATAKRNDVAVMVLGEESLMAGEAASNATLKLAGRQQELLEAIVATGKPVVLVLINGRPLDIGWAAGHVPAILEAWEPGTQGGNAVADILFGDANPGGKLTVTWPRSAGQEPLYYAHTLTQEPETKTDFLSRYQDVKSTPLYPFGYGLSYTKFDVTNLKLDKATLPIGGAVGVSVDVQNTGAVVGDEVVQVYIHQQSGSASRPVRQLKGFEKVTLAPGEKKTLHFTLGKDELTYWSPSEKKWVLEPAMFDVWAG